MWKADVAFVISRNYIGQFKVTFHSLVNSNADALFCVHLLHSDLCEEDIVDLERFTAARNAEIRFYAIDDGAFAGLPKMQGDHSYSAYYKVLLPYYLCGAQKVLFLDCDIIVCSSVKPLFDLSPKTFLSCASDYKINKKRKEHKEKIIGNAATPYFNSGVMLMDFSHSDEIVPREALFDYIGENKDIIRWHDQDILNHFYAPNCTVLEEKYNYLTTYKSIINVIFPKGKRKAIVVHYANWKPWRSNYIGKCYRLYKRNYKALAGEKGVDFLSKRSLSAQIKLIFKYITGKK